MAGRTKLACECHELRTQLKEWEREFAGANSGRKPGKEDIKKNLDIAAKYKTYNRKRDVLDGKIKDPELLQARSPSIRKHTSISSSTAVEQDPGHASLKTLLFATPRKARPQPSEFHPSNLDPYDVLPASVSPHPYVFKNAIGPTPQRDGKILGLFDLLSGSGSTPSSRKRKADEMKEKGVGVNVEQTPSKRPARGAGDLLDHLGEDSGGKRHPRTPASDGKKFLLSQFFATPSTMRFAVNNAEEDEKEMMARNGIDHTPLRTKVLDGQAENKLQGLDALESTPTYLRRTTSFNRRLLPASGSNSQHLNSNGNLTFKSPDAVRRGPLKRPFKGRGLSEILLGLRQMEDNDDEDEMDALREIEGNELNVLVGDRQLRAEPDGGEEMPARAWKKKGQKRTTRKIIMRPTVMQRKSRTPEFDEDDNGMAAHQLTKVEETQYLSASDQPFAGTKDCADDLQPIPDDQVQNNTYSEHDLSAIEEESVEGHDLANSEYNDELGPSPKSKPPSHKRQTAPPTASEQPSKSSRHASGGADRAQQTTKTDEKETKKKTKGINPNAHSHLNFRSLKIRNRNSKAGGAKGKARFGRGRR